MNKEKFFRVWGKIALFIIGFQYLEMALRVWNSGYNNLSNPFAIPLYVALLIPYLIVGVPLWYFVFKKTN